MGIMVRFILLELLAIATFILGPGYGKSHAAVCTEDEKRALLSFKQYLNDPSNRLSSWHAKDDCCKWSGVVCDNFTGHVRELHLQNPCVTKGGDDAFRRLQLSGQINPSLLNLKHLSYLDLSRNDFGGIPIPSFIGSLVSLRRLNLSRAGFGGIIPHHLGNLSLLQSLDLRVSNAYILEVENLQWLSTLLCLEHLDLSRVNLQDSPNWLQVINMLSSLVELHMSDCQLEYIHPIRDINFTSLSVLDLSRNLFSFTVPNWIFSLKSLVSLHLSRNGFEGPIPIGLKNMTSLRNLDLSWNGFNSTIPDWLYSFSRLESLDLSSNVLQGTISSDIKNLTSIITLDLSNNKLQGKIPISSLRNLCNLKVFVLSGNKLEGEEVSELFQALSSCNSNPLESLRLSMNRLSGHLTDQIGQFKHLQFLDLSGNSISGPIPQSLGNLSKLETLLINDNLLEGVVSEAHFANLTSLSLLRAYGNQLILNISHRNWIPPFQLGQLELRGWQLGPWFPMWLQSQKDLVYLDLSQTRISDRIPDWFWNFSSSLGYLNLSHNQIHGKISYIPKFDSTSPEVYLASNQFTGPLPSMSPNINALDLSNNFFSGNISHFLCDEKDEPNQLEYLNLEGNLLSRDIPNCWMSWNSLRIIALGSNNLSGNIPSSMGILSGLSSLHLRRNTLSGEVPSSLQNCTKLKAIDLGENQFIGTIPNWFGYSFSYLNVLGLRSNRFHGEIPSELCSLQELQILDLANNHLSGRIPLCLKNLSSMTVKQTIIHGSSYAFYYDQIFDNAFVVTKGREIEYDTILSLATSIDLSNNHIFGEIPEELTSLVGLISLNFSKNRLTGKIPEKIGNMNSLESIDFSRNQLSGKIPPSMSGMTFLSHFNISHNDLSGKIPLSTQFQSLGTSSFIGNAELCGVPLTKNCGEDGLTTPDTREKEEEEDGKFEVAGFYLSMAIGFVLSFAGVCGPLMFSRSWRRLYYQFIDEKLYRLSVVLKKCT